MKDRTKRLIRNTSDENVAKLADKSDNIDVRDAARTEEAKREEHNRRQEGNGGR